MLFKNRKWCHHLKIAYWVKGQPHSPNWATVLLYMFKLNLKSRQSRMQVRYSESSFMRGSRKFCQRGSNFDVLGVFFSWWGEGGSKYHYKLAIIGPSAKHHLNDISLACRCWPNIEWWLGSFVIFRGSGPILLWNSIFLWFFRGVWPPAPLWICAWVFSFLQESICCGYSLEVY